MARTLRKLRVDFGSLVDVPANQHAHVLLFKRATPDPIEKMIREEDGKFCVYSASGKKLGEHNTRAEALAQLRAVEASKERAQKMSDTKTDHGTEDIAKRLADLEKRAKDAEDRATAAEAKHEEALTLAKAEKDARLTAEFIRKAEGFANLPVKPDVLGPILKKLTDALTAEEYTQVETVLRAANAASAAVFSEHGRGGGDAGQSATERLDTLAKSMVSEGKAKDYPAAITAISGNKEHAQLLRDYRAEQLRRN